MASARAVRLAAAILAASVEACTTDEPSPSDQPDTDGDGLVDAEEVGIWGTSPVLADTDGDGMSDREEIVVHGFDPSVDPLRFNPRVADVPRLGMTIVSAPAILLQMTDAHGVSYTWNPSRSITTTTSDTQGQSSSVSPSQSNERSTTVSDSVTTTPGSGGGGAGGGDAEPPDASDAGDAEDEGDAGDARDEDGDARRDAGARDADAATRDARLDREVPGAGGVTGGGTTGSAPSVSFTHGTSDTLTDTATLTTTYTVSEDVQQAYADTITQAEAFGQTHDVTASGGVLKVTAFARNDGELSFRITSLLLSATLDDVAPAARPVGNLAVDTPYQTYIPFTLAPGERAGPIVFVRDALTLPAAYDLMQSLGALAFTIAVAELSDAAGRPYEFSGADIQAKTAELDLDLDFGDGAPPRRLHVATNLVPGAPGVSLLTVLRDELALPVETDPSAGLVSVRSVGTPASGDGAWVVEVARGAEDDAGVTVKDARVEAWDPVHLVLRAGDVVRARFTRD